MPSVFGSTSRAASPSTSGSAPTAGREHRRAHAHRLERREPEPFVAGRVREQGRTREQIPRCVSSMRPSPGYATARARRVHVASNSAVFQPRTPASTRWMSGSVAATSSNARTSVARFFAVRSCRGRGYSAASPRAGGPRSGHPPKHRGCRCGPRGCGRSGRRRRRRPRVRRTRRGYGHARPGAAPADQRRVLDRVHVAVLRVVHRREIVHGHELGRGSAGGTTKFGPCTTSMAPVQYSIGGQSTRFQSCRVVRAGIAVAGTVIPGGTAALNSSR